MQLKGYLKLTLKDYPGKIAAICFTQGCQLRCVFCHNPELVLLEEKNSNIEDEKQVVSFLDYLKQRKKQLEGVVVSGGEPLLQPDIADFLVKIKELNLKIKLDTNGFKSKQLNELIQDGLVDYVAMDYKNCRDKLAQTVGLMTQDSGEIIQNYYTQWRESLQWLRKGRIPYELRTTVTRELHPIQSLEQMAEEIWEGMPPEEIWFLQTFQKKGKLVGEYKKNSLSLSAYTDKEMEDIQLKIRDKGLNIRIR